MTNTRGAGALALVVVVLEHWLTRSLVSVGGCRQWKLG
jgi:hypothetical protein